MPGNRTFWERRYCCFCLWCLQLCLQQLQRSVPAQESWIQVPGQELFHVKTGAFDHNCRQISFIIFGSIDANFQYECVCGRKLASPQALGSHRRGCSAVTSSSLGSSTTFVSPSVSSTASSPSSNSTYSMPPPPPPDSLTCCGRPFSHKAALLAHQRSKRHKVRSSFFFFCQTPTQCNSG